MQKFALLFLAASISFSGLLAPVQGQEIVNRETNGERLARGLNPLPPTKRDNHDKRPQPSPKWDGPSKRSVEHEARDRPDHPKPSSKWNGRSVANEARDRPDHPSQPKPSSKWNGRSVEARDRPDHPSQPKPSSKWNGPDKRSVDNEARDRPDHPSQPKPSGKWNGPDKRSEDEEFAKRETNADRFARGMLPLPPVKRAVPNEARDRPDHPKPSDKWNGPDKRSETIEARDRPSQPKPSNKWNGPSKRSASNEARDRPSQPKPSNKWNGPSKRSNEARDRPSQPKPSNKWNGPNKRSETKVVKRAEAFQMQQSYSGRLEVRWATNSSVAGYVANNPIGGSFGLNDPAQFGWDDLIVEYFDQNLLVMNPEFPSPYFVGGSGAHGCANKVPFANVQPGPSSAIWTLNPFTRALNATLTTQDGSEEKPSLAYDPARNVLSFTGHFNTPAEYPVYIYLSD